MSSPHDDPLLDLYRVRVKVSRRQGVFDPAARVIARTIDRLLDGENGALESLDIHKIYTLSLRARSSSHAGELAARLCRELLVEPTLEDHVIEPLDATPLEHEPRSGGIKEDHQG